VKEQTASAADSTILKATPATTSNLTADAATSAPTPTPAEEKDNKTLTKYTESTAKQSVTSMDGTFMLIGKSLYFSDHQSSTLRLCIPEKLVSETLRLCHDACRHPGVHWTYLSASERFYFPWMSRKIKEHYDNCVTYQTSKHSHEKPISHLHPVLTPDEPFHTITMDFVTGLPPSHGHDAFLTIIDKFSKAIKLIPCKMTDSAEDIAKLYLQNAYATFGLPTKIISDRDPKFTSSFWSTLMRLLGVKMGITAAFHPQADGQSERTNATVEIALRCFLGGDIDLYPKWTEYLPIIELKYNNIPQASTNISPNDLHFAVHPRGIPDALLLDDTHSSEPAESLAENFQNRCSEAHDSIITAQRKQKELYDSKRRDFQFNVGDLALLRFHKFGSRYKPPPQHRYKIAPVSTPVYILEKLSPLSYRIQLLAGSRIHDMVSVVHLQYYKRTDTDIKLMPVQVDGVEEYEVERIEGERKIKGKKEFLVKWKGYGDAERTWEPLEHLDNAWSVLDEWIMQSSNKAHMDRTDTDKSNESDYNKLTDGDKPNESQSDPSIPLCRSSRHKKSSPE